MNRRKSTQASQDGSPAILQVPLAKLPEDRNDSRLSGYAELLEELKTRIHAAQTRAAVSVNRELVLLYWSIGREILARQLQEGWGAKVIDRLSSDLRREFPEMSGLSTRNLKYMRTLAETYPDREFVQQAVAQLPWGHNVRLLDAVKIPEEREFYLRQAIRHGWSRSVLVHQIESRLYERQGKALTNFDQTLPAPQSDLAREILKDPYNFDFLSLGPEAHERDLEQGLIDHVQRFLLELGVGFAFVGRQHRLDVEDESYYLDLLFYHLELRCFVVIDLKMRAFRPEDAGKMNFYLSAVDDLLRHPDDQPSIGLVLCKTKRRLVVEYALRDLSKPIGVSSYEMKLVESLPDDLRGRLPTIEELERELGGDDEELYSAGAVGGKQESTTEEVEAGGMPELSELEAGVLEAAGASWEVVLSTAELLEDVNRSRDFDGQPQVERPQVEQAVSSLQTAGCLEPVMPPRSHEGYRLTPMGKIAAVLRRHESHQRRRVARGKARQPSLPRMPEHVVRRFEDMDIAFLDLGTRFCNALKKHGLLTVGSLTRLTAKELLQLRQVSKRCVEAVEVELNGIGLGLRASAGRRRS